MKKGTFLSIFIVTHLLFIFLQIHKHMQFIKYSFAKQKYEKELQQVTHKKQELTNQLYAQQNRSTVKQYAQDQLGMKEIRLAQIKWLHTDGQ